MKGKKKEQGRKLPQIKGRHRCLKVKWKEREKKNRIRFPKARKSHGMAGMENESEKVGVEENNKVAMD